MAITDIAQRAAPFAQAAWEDDEIRDRLRNAVHQGRMAVAQARGGKKASNPSAIKRAGEAVQEAGRALVALGQTSKKQQRKQQRSSRTRLGLPVAIVTALAAGLLVSRRTSDTTTGGTNG